MLLFLKSILGGIVGVFLTWIVILICWHVWRANRIDPGPSGLASIAGTWEMLLHTPFILTLLTLAFGIGLWLVARRNF
jgi:hypothetical protein